MPLSYRCRVPSARVPGLDFHLLLVVHANHSGQDDLVAALADYLHFLRDSTTNYGDTVSLALLLVTEPRLLRMRHPVRHHL
jgi:hypothetical protein